MSLRTGLALALAVGLCLLTSATTMAARGELLGLGPVKFGMTVSEVAAALGPSAEVNFNRSNGRLVTGTIRLDQETFYLNQEIFNASFYFKSGLLWAIHLRPKSNGEWYCRGETIDMFLNLSNFYGPSDTGLEELKKFVGSETNPTLVRVEVAKFSFTNEAQIALVLFDVASPTLEFCEHVIEFVGNKRDSVVAAKRFADYEEFDPVQFWLFPPSVE